MATRSARNETSTQRPQPGLQILFGACAGDARRGRLLVEAVPVVPALAVPVVLGVAVLAVTVLAVGYREACNGVVIVLVFNRSTLNKGPFQACLIMLCLVLMTTLMMTYTASLHPP
ncbi:hypothetical protein MRX96_008020 [Rhipicephalus microplus]